MEMIKPVQQTSLDAFEGIWKNIGERQQQVYECLKRIGPANNKMIARELKLAINSVTPRINELRNKYKMVGYAFTSNCPITGKKSMFWKCIK
jgi:hypothetical protein